MPCMGPAGGRCLLGGKRSWKRGARCSCKGPGSLCLSFPSRTASPLGRGLCLAGAQGTVPGKSACRHQLQTPCAQRPPRGLAPPGPFLPDFPAGAGQAQGLTPVTPHRPGGARRRMPELPRRRDGPAADSTQRRGVSFHPGRAPCPQFLSRGGVRAGSCLPPQPCPLPCRACLPCTTRFGGFLPFPVAWSSRHQAEPLPREAKAPWAGQDDQAAAGTAGSQSPQARNQAAANWEMWGQVPRGQSLLQKRHRVR